MARRFYSRTGRYLGRSVSDSERRASWGALWKALPFVFVFLLVQDRCSGKKAAGSAYTVVRETNVRSQPSTQSEIVDTLGQGSRVNALSSHTSVDWLELPPDRYGKRYVWKGNLSLIRDTTSRKGGE